MYMYITFYSKLITLNFLWQNRMLQITAIESQYFFIPLPDLNENLNCV
jgi:hypothetical protein